MQLCHIHASLYVDSIDPVLMHLLIDPEYSICPAAIVGGGAILTLPMVRAMMSRITSPEKQGQY